MHLDLLEREEGHVNSQTRLYLLKIKLLPEPFLNAFAVSAKVGKKKFRGGAGKGDVETNAPIGGRQTIFSPTKLH